MKAFNLPVAADGNFLERRSGLSNLSCEAVRPKCVSRVTERLNWSMNVFGEEKKTSLLLANKNVEVKLKRETKQNSCFMFSASGNNC